jgi:hypothetical protein
MLLKVHSAILFIIFVGGSALLTATTLLMVRRLVPHHRLKQHNDVTGSVFATVGVLYAVLLAFVVIAVWQDFDRARMNVEKEVNCIADIYRMSVAFSPELRKDVCGLLKDYIQDVISEEWKAMASGGYSTRATATMGKLWLAYGSYIPKTKTEEIFLAESVYKLNELGESRRTRIMNANTGVHMVLWVVLLAGGVMTMTFISFFGAESLKTQMVMAVLLASLVGLILFTIAVMDYPFTGSVAISSEAFKPVLSCLR